MQGLIDLLPVKWECGKQNAVPQSFSNKNNYNYNILTQIENFPLFHRYTQQ